MKRISIIEIDKLDKKSTELLEVFLKENSFEFNTLFVSPAWIKKTLSSYNKENIS
jgi:hypothetical protein